MANPEQLLARWGSWLFGVVLSTSACSASHQIITSRRTPCRYEDVKVSEEQYMAGEETWLASCRGRSFRCSSKAEGTRVKYACRAVRPESPIAP